MSKKCSKSSPETPLNICTLILAFCEKNKGICKILTREALTPDEKKIEEKVNHLFERFELEIKLAFQNYEQSSKAKFNLTPTDSAGLIISILSHETIGAKRFLFWNLSYTKQHIRGRKSPKA